MRWLLGTNRALQWLFVDFVVVVVVVVVVIVVVIVIQNILG
jgi:hypothetical protein